VREAAAKIPEGVSERLDTADTLSDEDRQTIIEIARQALLAFQTKVEQNRGIQEDTKPRTEPKFDSKPNDSKPQRKSEAEQNTEEDTQPKAQAEPKSKPEPESKPKAAGKEKK
jgi:hypothetical protein